METIMPGTKVYKQADRIVNLYLNSNMKIREIAKETQLSVDSVFRVLRVRKVNKKRMITRRGK